MEDPADNVATVGTEESRLDASGRRIPAVKPSVWELVVPRVTPSQAVLLVPDMWRRFTLVHGVPAGEVVAKRIRRSGDAVFGQGLAIGDQGLLVAQKTGAVTLDHLGRVWLAELRRSPGLDDHPKVMVVDGSMVIDGPVGPDWCIRARGDVEVRGFVNGATIMAGGSVLVRGDVVGTSSSAMIVAGWDVTVNQAADTEILAGHDVAVADQLLNCNVTADGRVLVGNPPMKSGVITGGLVHAGREIAVYRAGSTSVFPPDLSVGPIPNTAVEDPDVNLPAESRRLSELRRQAYELAQKQESQDLSTHLTQVRQGYRSIWSLWLRERYLLNIGDSQPYFERIAIYGSLALGSQVTIGARRYTVGHQVAESRQFVVNGDQIIVEPAQPLEKPVGVTKPKVQVGQAAPTRGRKRLAVKLPSNLIHELDLVDAINCQPHDGQDVWQLLSKVEAELRQGQLAGTIKRFVVTDPVSKTPQGHCYLREDVIRVVKFLTEGAPAT
jgi:hypothetical protein